MKKLYFLFTLVLTFGCSSDDDGDLNWDTLPYGSYDISLKVLSAETLDFNSTIVIDDKNYFLGASAEKEFYSESHGTSFMQSRYTQNSDACKLKSQENNQDDVIQIENKGGPISVQIIYTEIDEAKKKHVISFEVPAGETYTENIPCRIEDPESFFNQ